MFPNNGRVIGGNGLDPGSLPPIISQPEWPLNQAHYQNMPNNQVDWAALAQQWIIMKENSPTNPSLDDAPPPPQISNRFDEEQGEAPMEVEKDEDEQIIHHNIPTMNSLTTTSLLGNVVNPTWQQSWMAPAAPQWRPDWSAWDNQGSSVMSQNLIGIGPPPVMRNNLSMPSNSNIDSWPNSMPLIDDRKDAMKQSTSAVMPNFSDDINTSEPSVSLDAAKRKTLPAWIREGLEKMEREKLKQMEREKEMEQKTNINRDDYLKETLNEIELNRTASVGRIHSKFDSESDSDEEEQQLSARNQHSEFDVDNKVHKETMSRQTSSGKVVIDKSSEELAQELMLTVRQVLTEILLDVTNEEIRNIAKDTVNKAQYKANTFRKSGISTISSKLGLGAYADSGSDSDSDDEANKGKSDDESDNQLREIIRQKKIAFETKIRNTEDRYQSQVDTRSDYPNDGGDKNIRTVTLSENKSIQNRNLYNNGGNGETHQDKSFLKHGRRLEKRSSRFNDIKDSLKSSSVVPPTQLIYPSASSSLSSVAKPVVTEMEKKPTIESDTNSSTSSASHSRQKRSNYEKTESKSSHSKSRKRHRSRSSSSGSSSYIKRSNKRVRTPTYGRDRRTKSSSNRGRSRSRSKSYDRHRHRGSRNRNHRSRSRSNTPKRDKNHSSSSRHHRRH